MSANRELRRIRDIDPATSLIATLWLNQASRVFSAYVGACPYCRGPARQWAAGWVETHGEPITEAEARHYWPDLDDIRRRLGGHRYVTGEA